MPSFNRVILMGNLTRDPEMRYLPSGKAVTEIGLAVNDRRKSPSGDWVDETTFVEITLWERQAEIASEYLSKGSPALIEGRLKLDTWETDGQKRSKMRVVGDRVVLLGNRSGGDGGSYSRSASQSTTSRPQQQQAPPADEYDYGPPPGEDVPF